MPIYRCHETAKRPMIITIRTWNAKNIKQLVSSKHTLNNSTRGESQKALEGAIGIYPIFYICSSYSYSNGVLSDVYLSENLQFPSLLKQSNTCVLP